MCGSSVSARSWVSTLLLLPVEILTSSALHRPQQRRSRSLGIYLVSWINVLSCYFRLQVGFCSSSSPFLLQHLEVCSRLAKYPLRNTINKLTHNLFWKFLLLPVVNLVLCLRSEPALCLCRSCPRLRCPLSSTSP